MRKTNSLKAFFTMCLLCVVGTLGAWAQTTVTFVAGMDKGDTDTHLTKKGITIQLSSGALKRDDNYRIYKNNKMTIKSEVGDIQNIVITCTGETNGPGNL